MTVKCNVAHPLRHTRDASADDAKERAVYWLCLLNVAESRWDVYPGSLSGGEQRRVAIARTLATDPDLLLLDEVTGFKYSVACTAAVWGKYIVPPQATEKLGQSERGRVHDLLWMLHCSIRGTGSKQRDQLLFKVIFLQAPCKHEEVTLKSVCGPGDNGEPVLTVMLPDED